MNILFLCTSNLHRSRTAEDYFRSKHPLIDFKSAGLSKKFCKQNKTKLCTVELLTKADKIFVMEEMHVKRIKEHTQNEFLNKITNLGIEDKYKYFDDELIELLVQRVDLNGLL